MIRREIKLQKSRENKCTYELIGLDRRNIAGRWRPLRRSCWEKCQSAEGTYAKTTGICRAHHTYYLVVTLQEQCVSSLITIRLKPERKKIVALTWTFLFLMNDFTTFFRVFKKIKIYKQGSSSVLKNVTQVQQQRRESPTVVGFYIDSQDACKVC